jgi:hypothetical protein
MIYKNLEVKRRNYKKILLNILVIILLLTSIIYIYISNNSINSNTRRKINEIEKDITQLYNYTETMSDFIVDNYKPPKINFQILFEDIYKNHLDLKKDINEFKNQSLRNHLDLKKDINEFKNQSLRNHLELKGEIIEIKNKEKELNKNFIRKSAIEFLNKYYRLFNPNNKIYESKCSEKILNVNYNKLYEELLNIDYDNFIVSFAYFSENYEENFKQHPIYKKINDTLEFDYKFFDLYTDYNNNYYSYYIESQSIYYSYYEPNFIGQIPYKSICGIISYYEIWNDKRIYYLEKIYKEKEYIKLLFPWKISVSPQKFM